MRDGEAVKVVEDLPGLVDQALTLARRLACGPHVVQASTPQAARASSRSIRASAAPNLSIRAGLASPERILQMLEGRHEAAAAPRPTTHGLTMLRYSEDRIVTDAELAAVAGR